RHWLPIELAGRTARGISATGIQATPGRIRALDPGVQHAVAHAVGNSLHDVFLLAAPIALAGAVIVTLLPERPLHGRGEPKVKSTEPRGDQPCPSSTPVTSGAGTSRAPTAARPFPSSSTTQSRVK